MRKQILKKLRLRQRRPMQKRRVFLIGFTTGLWEEAGMKLMMAKNPMAGESLKALGTLRIFWRMQRRMESGIWIPGIPKSIRTVMALRTAGMPGMCMTIELRGGSISRKKTEISLGEKRMIIRPTGIRKETEHLKGPFMAFLRRKTSFILMRR